MNKKRKKIINIISIFIIIGGLALVGFSPVFVDMLKKASAQNEGEIRDNVVITEDVNTEVTESTEMSYDTLGIEDTIYAVSMGEGEDYISLYSIEDVNNLSSEKNYMIETYEDWQKLYNFSQQSTLKDIIFWLYYPGQSTDSKTWELTSTDIQNGIGSKEYPFSGIIKPIYTNMTIKTSVPLFAYLSSDAMIGNEGHSNNNPMTIANTIVSMGEGNGAGGLATNYVIKAGEKVYLSGENSKFKNIKITGTITQVKGTVGGLFGNVILEDSSEASAEIILDSDSISVEGMTEVSGYIAGGLFGEVSGNITMTMNSMPSVAAKVYGYYDGYKSPLAWKYNDGFISQMKICAGGLIGKMKENAVLQTGTVEINEDTGNGNYLIIKNKVLSDGISGGLVGAVQNSSISVSYIEKDSIEEAANIEPYIWAKYIGGGFIGFADSSQIELDYLKLNSDVKVCYVGNTIKSSAGGIIGRYITNSDDTSSCLRISNIRTGNSQRVDTTDTDTTQRIFVYSKTDVSNNSGGIIGSCNGNQVEIKNISLSSNVYNVSLNYTIWTPDVPNTTGQKGETSYAITGGIAGSLSGMSIVISDVEFDLQCTNKLLNGNGLAGHTVGDIAGRVGIDQSIIYNEDEKKDKIETVNIPTKMKVSNITVKNSYVYSAYKYQGGLFGYVGKGALICLSDKIDISQIPFATLTPSGYVNRYFSWEIYVMLAPALNGGSRGFIAGYVEESLIYFEEGAEVTRSIKQDGDDLVSNMLDKDGKTYVALNPNNAIYYDYVIDDIGNAGSVFQNLKDSDGTLVIDYSKEYGKEVIGTVSKENGKYVIDSLGDALRLAIVGQTYDMSTGDLTFALNCFEDKKISYILSADYLITTNLNLGAANIQSFLRSDATINGSVLGFSGSMEGQTIDDSSPTITMNSISRHKNGGLYPLLQSADNNDTVSFKNLIIDGYMYYHLGSYNTITKKSEGGSGSIAARAIGSCSFENITIKTKIKGDMYDTVYTTSSNERMYSHGGLIGEYQLAGGTLTVTRCEFSPVITTIRSGNFVGGMVGRIDTSNEVGNIEIKNCTVGTKIIADTNYMLLKSTDSNKKFHARAAGLISFIGNDYKNIYDVNNSEIKFFPGTVEDKTYANITIDGIILKGAEIDFTAASCQTVNISGGLLGYAWCNVETTMQNITVGSEDGTEGCKINSLGYVGGLVSFVAGKVNISDITLNSLSMNSVDGNRSYSSFLFGNGECAYIILDQSTYNIEPNNVTISGYSTNFDEIVGSNILWTFSNDNNKEFDAVIYENYRDGGIVNIINSNFSDFTSSNNSYQSYVNRVCPNTNQYTRYYYNLFTGDAGSWNLGSGDLNIDSPKKLMTWHVGNYANTKLTRFFAPYFGGNTSYRDSKSVILSGTLDMSGYSLYPTSVDGVQINGSGAVIRLYGEEISDLENQLKTSSSSLVYRNNDLTTITGGTYTEVKTQHYLMHSSLLYCVNGAGVSGLTMKGTVANNSKNSGSLIGGYANGNITISDIIFDGLRISHYKDRDTTSSGQNSASLMIGQIGINGWNSPSASVNISQITMKGYDNITAGIVAAALISEVGNSGTKDVQITFTDMKLMDKKADSPFNYASLIYKFEYSSDSKDNKTYGIYTFDYADTVNGENKRDDHNVTYGEEIKDGLHYDDCYIADIPEGQDNPLKEAIVEAGSGTYLPYVCNNKDIYVNPKSGDITKGCGTYEDPYIIENISQFMTLFCYLSGEDDTYRSFLQPANNGWKVVPVGGDGDAYECNKNHDNVVATYGVDANFPTVDEMRTAYYMITADINLVDSGDVNYSALIKRFSGLGSYKYPFSGVIIGQKDGNGKFPEITLPGKDHDYTSYSNFGLIEYMQGAVVKDLNIKNNGWVIVSNAAGGVSAVVAGGDNIIDNVTVSMEFRINNAVVGGYVGNIENGSLILRNIDGKNVAKDCEFFSHYPVSGPPDCYTVAAFNKNTKGSLTTSNQVGLLVGKVEDGYVLYDGSKFGTEKKVLTNADVNVTDSAEEVSPLINGFELINGAALDAVVSSNKIEVNDKATTSYIEDDYDVRIKNAEELEIIALALNSDSLSVYMDESYSDVENRTEHLSGYDYTSKCRKANYIDVGSEDAKNGTSIDCKFAKDYDNGWIKKADTEAGSGFTSSTINFYSYPYLCYKYMSFNKATDEASNYENYKSTILEVSVDDADIKYISKLNKADENVKQYTTTYKLRDNTGTGMYDLSNYGNSFRGIGALYSKGYSDFRGNFDGGGNSVKIYMNRDWDSQLAITGMFNSLVYHNKNATTGKNEALTIKKLVIVDSVFQNTLNTEMIYTDDDNATLQGAARGAATGSLAGELEGVWEIKDITVKRESAEAQNRVSLLAALSDEDYTKELVCGVRGYMNVGGLIGRVNVTNNVSTSYGKKELHDSSNDIVIKRCNIEGVSNDKAVNIQLGSNGFAAGGLIGSIGANINSKDYNTLTKKYCYFGNVSLEGCSIKYINVLAKDSGFLGGFAGTVGYRHDHFCRSIGSVEVTYNVSSDENGEYIYTTNVLQNVNIISNVTNDTYDKYSAGGVFGQVEVLAIKPLEKDSQERCHRNVEMSTVSAESRILYTYLDNVVINIQSTNYTKSDSSEGYNLSYNSNGIGGLIGYLNCRKMSIGAVQVANSKIGVNDGIYAKTNVGGLIGFSSSNGEWNSENKSNAYGFYTNFLEIVDAKVWNSQMMCDQQDASAGGFVGYLSSEVVSIYGASEYSVSQGNTISSMGSGNANAGGIIGCVSPTSYVPEGYAESKNVSYTNEHWIYYVDVLNNQITSTNQHAGGLIGHFKTNTINSRRYDNKLYLANIRIGNQDAVNENTSVEESDTTSTSYKDVSNQITGGIYAGGLCGVTDDKTSVLYLGPVKVGSLNSDYNTIVGRVTGGLIGKHISNNEYFETNEVEIVKNRIVATSLSSPYTVSGGACGVRTYQATSYTAVTYTIKENLIIATGIAGKPVDKELYLSCGGIYGKVDYIYGQSASAQYFDDITLSNNSIGYYPVSSEKAANGISSIVEELKTLTNQSKEVSLFKRKSDGSLTYGNWRTFDINESNVGDYSYRIGNYFGEYNEAALNYFHCVILRPTLEYSKEIGSIPAIDVAHTKTYYQETASPSEYGYINAEGGGAFPYNYRAKCHIIYLDDYAYADNIVDISSSASGVLPVLDNSVLAKHGETTVTTETTDETTGTTTTIESTIPVYETEYFFGGIESIVSDYTEDKNCKVTDEGEDSVAITQEDATYAFLTSKRLDITLGGIENSNLICASPDKDDYFSTSYVADTNLYNGVPVIEVDGQSIQYIGDYVAGILTNGGGIYQRGTSNAFNTFLTISCVNAYIDPDGRIYAVNDDGSVGGTGKIHTGSIVVSDNVLSSEGCPYDVVIDKDDKKYYTISLLCYTYNSYKYDTTEKKETIYIPVFVTKKVTVNSYLSILEGEEYSLEQAAVNGYNNAVISHDSTYTVYSEFVYDDVRMEDGFRDIEIEKTLVFETNGHEAIKMQSGTKYTLIDVQTGKEYYYEVPEGGVSQIPFSYFLDADGNSYSQRNIGDEITTTKTDYKSITHKDSEDTPDSFEGEVGLEQFFMVVRPSGKDNNMSFRLSIDAKAVDANNENKEELVRKFLTEGVNITNIFGPLIGFEGVSVTDNVLSGTEGVTEIIGKISREETLTVDGRIRISVVPESNPNSERGGSPYWVNKANGNTIDSSNTGKYLEIGVTLIDEDGQEVQWPEGTNVIMNGGSPKPLQGNSVIYTYKDNGETFAFDTLSHDIANGVWYYYNVSSDDNTPEYRWITYDSNGKWYYKEYQRGANGNLILSTVKLEDSFVFDNDKVIVSNQCHLEFDFSVADIKDYAGKSYTVRINLYRSSDPEFPLEEAGVAVADGSIREYAKTIFAEGAADLAAAITPDNLLDLGINLYQNDQTTHEISFSNKLDFTDLISEKEPKLSADVAECAAQKYMVTYRIYKKTLISEGSGYQYELVNLNDANSPFTLYQVDGNSENQTETVIPIKEITMADGTIEYAFVASQKFTTDEIKAGTDGKTAYVTSWNMKLKIDSKKMTDSDLANYKIEATYLPYSQDEIPENDEESTLKDYFIFTIAKLKTDF